MEIRITKRAAERLRQQHPWVYRSELLTEPASEGLAAGCLVTVADAAGRPLGSALYSSTSQIALRVVSRSPGLDRRQYLEQLWSRVQEALAYRRALKVVDTSVAESNAERLLFSEADGVPGIVADRYASVIVLQLLVQGTAQDDVRSTVADVFRREFSSAAELTVWERPDPRIRELEQLPEPPPGPVLHRGDQAPLRETAFSLNGNRFRYNVDAGQKTGAFLDQRLNYRAAADWVRRFGKTAHALDICTYQGGFALHLAEVCERVTGVDQSRSALEVAEQNLQTNPHLRAQVDWVEADAFELLRALDDAARGRANTIQGPAGLPTRLSAIVLDPPAFAKSKRAAEGALRGYKELNLRAMRLLEPGGVLVTCSCSHHVALPEFVDVVRQAASDASRTVQVLETRGAAPDHPELLSVPETSYLKCLVCRVI